jgi:integrase/recombinase XerD
VPEDVHPARALLHYLEWHRSELHTEATVRAYSKTLSPFVAWLEYQDVTTLSEISPFHIISYMGQPKKDGSPKAPDYVRSICAAIKAFFKWAVAVKLLDEDPSEVVTRPKVPRISKPFLKEDEFYQLIDLCPLNTFTGARRQSMLWVLITTGLRLKELHELRLDDVDAGLRTVQIRMGKGQKERKVPLLKEVREPLRRYLDARVDLRPELWMTTYGKPLSYWGIAQ